MFSNSWDLTKILNRIQDITVQKVYSFNRQECINSKPVLQSGNENLLEYRCFLALHVDFCNPVRIIEKLENQMKSREPFEWIYNGIYMGSFVIESIEKTFKKQIKGTVYYAEVTFSLLEYPYCTDFENEETTDVDLSDYEQYESVSDKLTAFASTVKDTITDNIKDAVLSAASSGSLTEAAQTLFSSVVGGITDDLTTTGITTIFDSAEYYADLIENTADLDITDIDSLVEAVTGIPDTMLDCALRSAS